MTKAVRWLRVSYWAGAIADALAAAAMLVPELGGALYGRTDFVPTEDYRYAMGLGGSLMVGWTMLLLWADRKPVERRGVLLLTVFPVIVGLALAGVYAVTSNLVPIANMIPTWVVQAGLVLLMSFSYWRSRPGQGPSIEATDKGTGLAEAAAEFLSNKRVAVAGVSRSGTQPANLIYRKLRETGVQVFATNPNAERVEGDPCYQNLSKIPGGVDAVVVATHPDKALEVARHCKDAGVRYVWFHRSIDAGSVTPEAVAFCRAYGAMVIPGGCPMMHLDPVDFGHRCMRGVLSLTGRLPKQVERA